MNLALYAGIGLLVASFIFAAKQYQAKSAKHGAKEHHDEEETSHEHGEEKKKGTDHAEHSSAHHKVLHSVQHWFQHNTGQLFKLLTLGVLLFILYHVAWKSDVIRPEVEVRINSAFFQRYKTELILAAALLFGWLIYSLRGGHHGGAGAHLLEHGKEFLGRTWTVLMCAFVLVGIVSCATETWHINTMMAGWRQAEAEKFATLTPDDIRLVTWSTNFVLQPGESKDVIAPGSLKFRFDAPEVGNWDVLRQNIYFNRAPTTNGYIIVPLTTNMVMFWSTNTYDRNTEHIERFTSTAPVPKRIQVHFGH